MTDPVKSKDVEDVLASIRRLVSYQPTPSAPQSLAEPQKLVLSAEHRVAKDAPVDQVSVEPPKDPVPEAPFAQDVTSAKASALPEVEVLARRLLGADEARLRNIVATEIDKALSDEAQPDEPDSLAEATLDVAVARLNPRDVLRLVSPLPPEETAPLVPPVLSWAYSTPEPDRAGAQSLELKIAELEALIARSNTQFEPEQEGHGENAAATPPDEARIPWDSTLETELSDHETDAYAEAIGSAPNSAPPVIDATDDATAPEASKPDGSDDAILADDLSQGDDMPAHADAIEDTGALETGLDADIADETVPEFVSSRHGAGAEDASETADLVQDDVPVLSEPGHLTLVPTPDTTAEALISEDELRQLVARMIREELQGVLGERITRNVRKLVRREVQRALAEHDLD